jgi:NADPH:quinone reductase-like Zn-dependent oxidoreductase
MKAAVLHQLGQVPKYEEFEEPVVQDEGYLMVKVKASAVKNLDKARVSGAHYASYSTLPQVVGMDGVGILADGTRVYASGVTGMMAEKAIINKQKYVAIPNDLDDATAAALPNAVFGAALALKYRAEIKPGNVVLVNGATGVTGQAAVQIAKYYGASKVIATGRNEDMLNKLLQLGADEIISLKQNDETIIQRLKAIHAITPIDIVIDYVWGHPAELLLQSLKGDSLHGYPHKARYVTVGEMAGSTISLPSSILRSSPVELLGSGFGSLSKEAMATEPEILKDMFLLAANGKLVIETVTRELKDIETAWNEKIADGKRLVIVM